MVSSHLVILWVLLCTHLDYETYGLTLGSTEGRSSIQISPYKSLLPCLMNDIYHNLIFSNVFLLLFQVESIVLSIISMLSGPNDESPANVEAAVSDCWLLIFLVLFISKELWCATCECANASS